MSTLRGSTATVALFSLTALTTATPLTAQSSLLLSAGARYTSPLVRDSIGPEPITLRPALAPALQVALSLDLDGPWAAAAALDLATSPLNRRLGRLTTLALHVTLRRAVVPVLSAFAGVGALAYLPADDAGVFAQGSGSVKPLGVGGVAWRRHGLTLEARYDVHRFHTPALRATGFTDGRTVHRIALLVGVTRRLGS